MSTGILLNTALSTIAPSHFADSTVNPNVGDNWVMAEGNLQNLARALDMAYRELLGVNMSSVISRLNLEAMAESQATPELIALTELVLGLAVQVPEKQKYISVITSFPKDVQVLLMTLIKRIMEQSKSLEASAAELAASPTASVGTSHNPQTPGATPPSSALSPAPGDGGAEAAELRTQVFDLENKVADLQDALEMATAARDSIEVKAQKAMHSVEELTILQEQSTAQIAELKGELDRAQARGENAQALAAESIKAEASRAQEQILAADEKAEAASRLAKEKAAQVETLTSRISSLQEVEESYAELKDECDALRIAAGKADKLERQLNKYKERIAGLGDLKRQMDELQAENDRNVQKLGDATSKAARVSHLESQVADYRNQLTEAESRLSSVSMERERLESKLGKAKEALKDAAQENEILRSSASSGGQGGEGGGGGAGDASPSPSSDLFTADLQARIRKLEEENRMLKASAAGSGESGDASAALASMQEVLEKVQLTRDKLQEELDGARRVIHTHEDTIEDLEAQLSASSSANLGSALEADKARMALESLAKAERALETQTSAAAAATKEVTELKRELGTVKEALERVQQENVSLESKLSLVGADQETMLASLRAESEAAVAAALESERSAAQAALEDARGDADRAQAEADAAAARVAELETSLAAATESESELRAALERTSTELNDALKAKSAKADEMLAAKEELAGKESEIAGLNASMATLQGKIELLEHTSSASAGSSEEAAALRAQLSERVEALHALQLELAEAKGAAEQEKVRTGAVQDRLDSVSAQLETAQGTISSLQTAAAAAAAASSSSTASSIPAEAIQHFKDTIAELQAAVSGKEKEVTFFKSQFLEAKEVFSRENRLVTTAFYNMGLELQRIKAMSRVEGGGGGGAGWLNRK